MSQKSIKTLAEESARKGIHFAIQNFKRELFAKYGMVQGSSLMEKLIKEELSKRLIIKSVNLLS